MINVEKLYHTLEELPEPMVHEVFDFAEFLKHKHQQDITHRVRNVGQEIHDLFKGLHGDDILLPSRHVMRNPPDL